MNQRNFEGLVYRSIFELIEKNKDEITAARPRVSKNAAGYYLWNVWDGETFDLTKLIVGSIGDVGSIGGPTGDIVQAMDDFPDTDA